MAHARTQIRNAVIGRLAGLPTTGNRVYPGRVLPIDPDRLGGPALRVFCGDEEVQSMTIGSPSVEQHDLVIHVDGIVKAAVDLEDLLDQIALEVQQAMTPEGIGKSCELAAVRAGLDESLEKPCGVISLIYKVMYHVTSDAPGVLV